MQLGRGQRENPARACTAANGRRQHQPAPHAPGYPRETLHAPALPHSSWIDGASGTDPRAEEYPGLSVQCPGKPSRGSRTSWRGTTHNCLVSLKKEKQERGKYEPPAPFSRGSCRGHVNDVMLSKAKTRRGRAARIIWDPNSACCRQSGCRRRQRAEVLRGIDWVW